MAPPKFNFWETLDPKVFQNYERTYLSVAVFSGKKDPTADVIRIKVTGLRNEQWETIGEIALYRDKIEYRKLPPQIQPVQKKESVDAPDFPSKQESIDSPSEIENIESISEQSNNDDSIKKSEDNSVPEEEE